MRVDTSVQRRGDAHLPESAFEAEREVDVAVADEVGDREDHLEGDDPEGSGAERDDGSKAQVLSGLRSSSDEQVWRGGTIYDPTSGRTYRGTVQLDGEHRLHIRGYIGVPLLGRTTTWIRVGSEKQMCKR